MYVEVIFARNFSKRNNFPSKLEAQNVAVCLAYRQFFFRTDSTVYVYEAYYT